MQPGLEPDTVRMRNASPAIPHLYLACARIVRDVEHDALIKRAVYDKERWGNLPFERNDRVPVRCSGQLRHRACEHDGVDRLRMERFQGAIQKYVAMFAPEVVHAH